MAAARGIRKALETRFNVAAAQLKWEETAEAERQRLDGPVWVVEDGYLDIDRKGQETDMAAARDNDTSYWHDIAADKATAFAARVRATGTQLHPDFQILNGLTERFATAICQNLTRVAEDVRSVWEIYNDLASELERHRLRSAGSSNAVLPAEVALDLGNAVAAAMQFMRRFPTARDLDEPDIAAVTGTQGAEVKKLIDLARDKGLVPSSAAATVMGKLEGWDASGLAGTQGAAYAVAGARNLLVEMCGLLAAERLGRPGSRAPDRAGLLPRVKAVLRLVDDGAGSIVAGLSHGERHAIAAAIAAAGEGSDSDVNRPPPDPLPTWAIEQGADSYGRYAVFRVPGTEVTQRMRWCPRGDFMMGSSPDTDPDSHDDERPRHKVTFAEGFWMFDTACTEALWTAVTGQEVPWKRGADFPVTAVRWTDARGFAERLNQLLPGLSLGLPSEAQWEYACRAGTETRYSFGDSVTPEQVRCGLDSTARPVPVGRLPANQWGFHEMHGNVWEWCEDAWHDNYADAPEDGSARTPADPASAGKRGASQAGRGRGRSHPAGADPA